MRTCYLLVLLLGVALASFSAPQDAARAEPAAARLGKVKDVVIYRHDRFYFNKNDGVRHIAGTILSLHPSTSANDDTAK